MDAGKVSRGFALPTVLIASVLMLTVIVAAAGAVANVRAGLDSQYYDSLANDAAEAGVTYGSLCIKANSSWGVNVLTPKTDCSGTVQGTQSQYVASTSSYQTSFTVGSVNNTGAGTYFATSTGKVELLRSNGTIWKTFTRTANMQTGGQISTNRVVFGYSAGSAGNGVFFGAVGGDGKMRTVGWNAYGQLGNGSTSSTLTPTIFSTPSPVVGAYTSFLSGGTNLFAVTSDGNAYGAGWNNQWQLGINSNTTPIATPTRVIMPGSVKVLSITTGGDRTFLLGDDHNLYATGNCDYGQLGTNYTVSGCYNVHVPTRVGLPTYSSADPNTDPTSQVVTDRASAYVVMRGGALYGWGTDDLGQLWDPVWNNTFTNTSVPKKIGAYGDYLQPKVVQVATDGDTAYILDDWGNIHSIGLNSSGEMGNNTMSLYAYDASKHCMDDKGGSNGAAVWLWTCNGTTPQKMSVRWWNNSIQSTSTWRCVDTGGGTGNYTGLTWQGCAVDASGQAIPNQRFIWQPKIGGWSGRFYNPQSGRCIDNTNGNGTDLQLYDCSDSYVNQKFTGYNGDLTALDMSGISGYVVKIATDLWSLSFLTSNGEVWSAGLNLTGQFGNGGTVNVNGANFNPNPTKFQLPSGVTAVDLYQTSSWATQQNLFVIGSDGKVYGAGSNSHGELGNGTNTAQASPVLMSVIDGSTIKARTVKSGLSTTVIYTTDGSVYTVGSNTNGQLGDGTTNDSWVPIKAKYTNNLGTSVY